MRPKVAVEQQVVGDLEPTHIPRPTHIVHRNCDQKQHARQSTTTTSLNAEERFDLPKQICGHKKTDRTSDRINDGDRLAAVLLQIVPLLGCQIIGHA